MRQCYYKTFEECNTSILPRMPLRALATPGRVTTQESPPSVPAGSLWLPWPVCLVYLLPASNGVSFICSSSLPCQQPCQHGGLVLLNARATVRVGVDLLAQLVEALGMRMSFTLSHRQIPHSRWSEGGRRRAGQLLHVWVSGPYKRVDNGSSQGWTVLLEQLDSGSKPLLFVVRGRC